MLKIGDFARLGQVSVRMLRNYDELGLLTPAHIDQWTNYRSYTAGQLARLNRIVALKGLGFSLDAVGRLLDENLTVEQLQGMLRLRRAELAEELRSTSERLAAVERRLHLIEGEATMSEREFVVKSLPAIRMAERTATAANQEEISAYVGPLFDQVADALMAAGAHLGSAVGYYLTTEDGLECHAGFAYDGAAAEGFEIGDLPGVDDAVTLVHLGSMATIGESWQAIGGWLGDNGAEPSGACREIYLETPMDDQDRWVTELQQPFVRRT
jgi:DNA-binding transcriptional MerR regulator